MRQQTAHGIPIWMHVVSDILDCRSSELPDHRSDRPGKSVHRKSLCGIALIRDITNGCFHHLAAHYTD